jgi:geranylgeranyl transferase type-1 subunit beta
MPSSLLRGAGNEAHGGSTYTAIASLVLMDRLACLGPERRANLIRWCMMRQNQGYSGRTNKVNDSCYSFWIGATLHLLGEFQNTHVPSTREFVLGQCQHKLLGGFAKMPGAPPDILHTFYSLCWLAMAQVSTTRLTVCPAIWRLND